MRTVGRLLRLSLLPSAAADVACGALLGNSGQWPGGARPWLLILASLGVYHGAMALNDWADRAHDARTRPERPIPSGAIPAPVALGIAAGLTLLGLLAASQVGLRAAAWAGVLAVLSWSYDLFGRGPLLGPLLLGACRAGNLLLGLWLWHFVLPAEEPPRLVLAPLLYGGYVFTVSVLGRLEDGEGAIRGDRPRTLLRIAAVLLVSPVVMPLEHATLVGRALALVVAGAGAVGLWRAAGQEGPWTPPKVGASMGLALRRLLIFTAACALLAGTLDALVVAACILAGYPLSFALRKVFPPS